MSNLLGLYVVLIYYCDFASVEVVIKTYLLTYLLC